MIPGMTSSTSDHIGFGAQGAGKRLFSIGREPRSPPDARPVPD